MRAPSPALPWRTPAPAQARLTGAPLKKETKDQIAKAMMDWAVKRGAVNFAHWFAPMRGTCAQKHDGARLGTRAAVASERARLARARRAPL